MVPVINHLMKALEVIFEDPQDDESLEELRVLYESLKAGKYKAGIDALGTTIMRNWK